MWPAGQRTVYLICCQILKIFITSIRIKPLNSEFAFIFLKSIRKSCSEEATAPPSGFKERVVGHPPERLLAPATTWEPPLPPHPPPSQPGGACRIFPRRPGPTGATNQGYLKPRPNVPWPGHGAAVLIKVLPRKCLWHMPVLILFLVHDHKGWLHDYKFTLSKHYIFVFALILLE